MTLSRDQHLLLHALHKQPARFEFEFREAKRLGKVSLKTVMVAGDKDQREQLQALSLMACISRSIKPNAVRKPRGYSETYTVTALGRHEAGIEGARMPQRHRGTVPAFEFDDEEMDT